MAKDPLVPINTPFGYNIGINYETWENGRKGYSIKADLNQITQYFGLIKTFHDVATGTAHPSEPQIDPTQQQVISYVVKTPDVQLAMGTLSSALAQGGFGSPWVAGMMTSPAYTDKWVQMIISSFGSTAAAQKHLKMILLGNEIDRNGPRPEETADFRNYKTWINQSFTNLSASLAKFGLGSIPVSTTIANYGSSNEIAVFATDLIQKNWSKAWNGGKPIVIYNQYTPETVHGPMSSTDFGPVINYFEGVYTQLKGKVAPFIGETGYSTTYGQANQVKVYNQISKWLDGQYKQNGRTVPLFAFDAFDQPTRDPPFEVGFGIFAQNKTSKPDGLKQGLTLPSWTKTPISKAGNDTLHLYQGTFNAGKSIDAEHGKDTLVLAEPVTVNLRKGTLANIERLVGSQGDDVVILSAEQFADFSIIDLRDGNDTLDVVVKGSFDFLPDFPTLVDIESRNLVGNGRASLTLDQLGRFTSVEARLKVALTDWAPKLEALTPAQVAALGTWGVDRIDALGKKLTWTVEKYEALGPVTLTPDDKVTLADTGANIASLADFGALGPNGIDGIDATDDTLEITVAQYRALGGVTLAAGDVVTIADTGANIASLSVAEMAGLAAAGIDRLDATDDALALGIDQFAALGPVVISPGDALALTGTGGDDRFRFSHQTFGATDQVNAGAGIDILLLQGAGHDALAFGASSLIDVERIGLGAGHDYSLTTVDENVGAGRRLVVNGAHLDAFDSLIFDGSAETDGVFKLIGGAGTSRFTGGNGGNGGDTIVAGAGIDTIRYTAVAQSTGIGHDTVRGFDAALDRFDLGSLVAVTAVDAPVTTGALDKRSFDADLGAAMAGLAAGHAGLFTPDSGNLAGVTFLVADVNGVAGYQGGADLVVRLDNPSGSIGPGNFT